MLSTDRAESSTITAPQAAALDADQVDAHVREVAALLPFRVDLDADMGGLFVLQIDLGTRGAEDDAPDRAGIDPDEVGATWWIETQGGEAVELSWLTADSDTERVALWVAERARALGCPAAAKRPEWAEVSRWVDARREA